MTWKHDVPEQWDSDTLKIIRCNIGDVYFCNVENTWNQAPCKMFKRPIMQNHVPRKFNGSCWKTLEGIVS